MIQGMAPNTKSEGLGGILVINLDQRPERLEYFRSQALKIPALREWQRLPAVLGIEVHGYSKPPWFRNGKRDKSWAGRAGCNLSHRKAIERARDSGWDSVLILEDDAVFSDHFEQAIKAVEQQSYWDLCYLGYSSAVRPYGKSIKLIENHELVDVFGCYTTHAYILRSQTFEWLLDSLPEEGNIWPWLAKHGVIDRWYSRNVSRKFKVVAISPGVAGQFTDFSDISQRDGGDHREAEFFKPIETYGLDDDGFRAASRITIIKLIFREWLDNVRALVKKSKGF